MSEELGTAGELAVTSFWGGAAGGSCVQFTPIGPEREYAQLTRDEVRTLVGLLTPYLRDTPAPVPASLPEARFLASVKADHAARRGQAGDGGGGA